MAKFDVDKIASDARKAIDQSEKVVATLTARLEKAETKVTEATTKRDEIKAKIETEKASVEAARAYLAPKADTQTVAVEGVPSEGAFGQF